MIVAPQTIYATITQRKDNYLMQNSNKIVIFDWGGIVFNFQAEDAIIQIWSNVASKLKLSIPEEALKQWNEWGFDMSSDSYKIVNNDFYRVFKLCGIEADAKLIKKCRLIVDEEIKKAPKHHKVADFINNLIASDRCLVGVLSNLSVCYAPAINAHLPLSAFDYVWLSFKMGCQKPQNDIYEKVEKDCGLNPSDILFFDDSEKNISAAQKRGWNTCLIDETLDEDLRVKIISDTIDNFLNTEKDCKC